MNRHLRFRKLVFVAFWGSILNSPGSSLTEFLDVPGLFLRALLVLLGRVSCCGHALSRARVTRTHERCWTFCFFGKTMFVVSEKSLDFFSQSTRKVRIADSAANQILGYSGNLSRHQLKVPWLAFEGTSRQWSTKKRRRCLINIRGGFLSK